MPGMPHVTKAVIYPLFFLSGASALIYEVVWVRYFSLIFGGSHLAVTTVLSVFMAGLALGSFVIGKRVDLSDKPLRMYGFLEIGIAAFAVLFVLLMKIYPHVYIPLAQVGEGSSIYLSLIRVLFAVVAMIVPTTLMGGTLPVLSRFVSRVPETLGKRLSILYGLNTLGAVTGTLGAGFLLLPSITVNGTLAVAIGINLAIGVASILLEEKGSVSSARPLEPDRKSEIAEVPDTASRSRGEGLFPYRGILWGIGISGFCALGYEVLWTRILSIVIGTTVYGFTIMLVAFLAGIAAGGGAYGVFVRIFATRDSDPGRSFLAFGLVQIIIGCAALAVTYSLRDLPTHANRIRILLLGTSRLDFEMRQGANLIVAFSYMFVPAFFMGLAFPLAGKIHAHFRKVVGRAVGEVALYNTVGAILGAACSGFVLIYLFGIERSLQFLTVVNIGAGLWFAASATRRKGVAWAVTGLPIIVFLALAWDEARWKVWDMNYFAIYRNNQRGVFDSPFKIKDALENTDVLFFHEGINETISVIKPRGGALGLLVNGKVVASSTRQDIQCQMTLGHLPMLLHENPRKVWVLGLGTAMTLGAVSVHPEVEEITLAEIEPDVVPAARTFGRFNHQVLEDPKLNIVFNDGRNYLMTTKDRYDVITADPIHPWAQGAAYLYTTEYFRMAANRLRPGGIMCQWLPIYELTVDDLKSVVRTFRENFRYSLLWLTHYDAELIGSNSPIVIDETKLAARMAVRPIRDDLESVEMGSATDFLSYFVMGSRGLDAFSEDGAVNTDGNLNLEFSAPLSVGVNTMGRNVSMLTRYRENLLTYLVPADGKSERTRQEKRWDENYEIGNAYDIAHALYLAGGYETPEFAKLMAHLEELDPEYAPTRFLKEEYVEKLSGSPNLLRRESFALAGDGGERVVLEISAVTMRIGKERAVVMFVDNRAREIFGQQYVDGRQEEMAGRVGKISDEVMEGFRSAYEEEATLAGSQGRSYPSALRMRRKIREVIDAKVWGNQSPP